MELNEYQKQAMTTCMQSCDNIPYMLINLQGEVGELSSKIAKAIRKGQLGFKENKDGMPNCHYWLNGNPHKDPEFEPFINALTGELGDVLWQLSGICSVLGISLDEVARYNLDKLSSRKERGVIDGNGDNR